MCNEPLTLRPLIRLHHLFLYNKMSGFFCPVGLSQIKTNATHNYSQNCARTVPCTQLTICNTTCSALQACMHFHTPLDKEAKHLYICTPKTIPKHNRCPWKIRNLLMSPIGLRPAASSALLAMTLEQTTGLSAIAHPVVPVLAFQPWRFAGDAPRADHWPFCHCTASSPGCRTPVFRARVCSLNMFCMAASTIVASFAGILVKVFHCNRRRQHGTLSAWAPQAATVVRRGSPYMRHCNCLGKAPSKRRRGSPPTYLGGPQPPEQT